MPTIDTFDYGDVADLTALRLYAERLDKLRVRDYSPLEQEQVDWMPMAAAEGALPMLQLMHIVESACEHGAELYAIDPRRKFENVSAAGAEKLARTYKRACLNDEIARTARRSWALRSLVVGADPKGRDQVDLGSWGVHEAAVYFNDPWQTDIRLAERVEVLVPVKSEPNQLGNIQLQYNRRVYTKKEAYTVHTERSGKTKHPIFGDSTSHKFGRIPLAALHLDGPRRGIWWGSINFDLYRLAVTICLHLSHVMDILALQTPAEGTLTGFGAKEAYSEVPDGPRFVKVFDQGVPDEEAGGSALKYQQHQANPPVEAYLKAIVTLVELHERTNGFPPGSLLESTGITGNAKAMESRTAVRKRRQTEKTFARFESDLAELVAEVLEADNRRNFVEIRERDEYGARPAAGANVRYRYVEPETNDLQREQAKDMRYGWGEDAPWLQLAAAEGLTEDEAFELAKQRIERAGELKKLAQKLGVDTGQGRDKLDNKLR